jgi:hypothetical protein
MMPGNTAMFRRLRKVVLIGAALAWTAAMGSSIVLDITYFNYPRITNPEISRIVPYEVKNVVVYITEGQSETLYWIRWIEITSGVLIFIGLILNQKWPLKTNK